MKSFTNASGKFNGMVQINYRSVKIDDLIQFIRRVPGMGELIYLELWKVRNGLRSKPDLSVGYRMGGFCY